MTPDIRISIRFYAELNDFLVPRLRQVAFEHVLHEHASVKHVIGRSACRTPLQPVAALADGGAAGHGQPRLRPGAGPQRRQRRRAGAGRVHCRLVVRPGRPVRVR
jgi:hypothetical protein